MYPVGKSSSSARKAPPNNEPAVDSGKSGAVHGDPRGRLGGAPTAQGTNHHPALSRPAIFETGHLSHWPTPARMGRNQGSWRFGLARGARSLAGRLPSAAKLKVLARLPAIIVARLLVPSRIDTSTAAEPLGHGAHGYMAGRRASRPPDPSAPVRRRAGLPGRRLPWCSILGDCFFSGSGPWGAARVAPTRLSYAARSGRGWPAAQASRLCSITTD